MNGFIGALLTEFPVLAGEALEELPQLGTQLGEKPLFSFWGMAGPPWGVFLVSDVPHTVGKFDVSNPFCAELELVGEGPKTEVFIIGEGAMADWDGWDGWEAKGEVPKIEVPVDFPEMLDLIVSERKLIKGLLISIGILACQQQFKRKMFN